LEGAVAAHGASFATDRRGGAEDSRQAVGWVERSEAQRNDASGDASAIALPFRSRTPAYPALPCTLLLCTLLFAAMRLNPSYQRLACSLEPIHAAASATRSARH